jgi:hypothetical protein
VADVPNTPPDQKPTPVSQVRTYAADAANVSGKPLPKEVVNVPAPRPAPSLVPPPPRAIPVPPPPPPQTSESREQVLARLRKNAGVIVPPPPILTPQPDVANTRRDELLERLKSRGGAKSPAVTPPPAVTVPDIPPGIPTLSKIAPLHTYKSDFADFSKKEGATPLTILAAQQDSRTQAQPVFTTQKKGAWVPILLGVLLIVGGGGIIFGGVFYLMNRPIAPEEILVPSLIFADERFRLSGTPSELQVQLANLSASSLREGGVAVAYITYSTTTPEGDVIEEPASGGALIANLSLTAPDILLRNTEPSSTVGVVRINNETRPYFILRVSSYERTFAGMLTWEETIKEDLSLFYPSYPATVVATTTASSTPIVPIVPPSEFVDETIANHDVRILKDSEGRSILLYGYRDKQTLIIARNEAAFVELVTRLSATRAQ